jgi:hypothetical protein
MFLSYHTGKGVPSSRTLARVPTRDTPVTTMHFPNSMLVTGGPDSSPIHCLFSGPPCSVLWSWAPGGDHAGRVCAEVWGRLREYAA